MMRMLRPLQSLFHAMTAFALTLTKDLSVTQVRLVNMLLCMEMGAQLMDTW